MHDKMIIKLFTLLKGYGYNMHMQTIAQAIIFNTNMLWVSADMSTPPLANMRFTITNDIHILGITFNSMLCKQLTFFRQLD